MSSLWDKNKNVIVSWLFDLDYYCSNIYYYRSESTMTVKSKHVIPLADGNKQEKKKRGSRQFAAPLC